MNLVIDQSNYRIYIEYSLILRSWTLILRDHELALRLCLVETKGNREDLVDQVYAHTESEEN